MPAQRVSSLMGKTAIIGAGMAGLACARRLSASGQAVTLFDKGRGVGGRVATRRVETAKGVLSFDHGAQYFTVRDERFRAELSGLAGAVAPWPEIPGLEEETRQVGVPHMNALPKAMAEGLDVRLSTKIAALRRDHEGWILEADDRAAFGPFEVVIVAVPAEQAVSLVASQSPMFAAEAAAARTAPCWAGLFAADALGPPPLAAQRLADHPVLAWVACDAAKPGRPSRALQTWVVHAKPDWSAAHLEGDPQMVLGALHEAFVEIVRPSAPVFFAAAHRWRYAQVAQPAATLFAWDPALGLGLCGDWRIGPRIEAAWVSGHALAGAVIAEMTAQ